MAVPEPNAPGTPFTGAGIPLCEPAIRGNEWRYIKECLDTNWVSSVGSFVDRLERELAALIGTQHAVVMVSGTAALHIALLVAGVQPDDEVLVPALTFIAPVNAIRYVGAWPVFMDVDTQFWQIDPQKVQGFLKHECVWRNGALWNRSSGRRVHAILPVHILGHPVDMDAITEIARQYELIVIEDAAEGLGARCRGRMVGCFGNVAALSFNGNKIITTGGGGAILTNNEAWARKAKYLSTQAKDDAVEYIHQEIGYNYRLSNIQAAFGVAQLEQLERHIAAKRRIARAYKDVLTDCSGIRCMSEASWAYSTFWMYTILVLEAQYGMSSRGLLRELGLVGITARPLWRPIPESPPYRNCQSYHCEVAQRLSRDALSLPCSVGLEPAAQQRVIEVILSAK